MKTMKKGHDVMLLNGNQSRVGGNRYINGYSLVILSERVAVYENI